MPPTETSRGGMLCLSRHENCPWDVALKDAKLNWSGLQYSCLKILHLYCKVFEREDVLEMVIRKTCKCCGCDRLSHAVYHEELASVRARLGLRDTRDARDTSRAEHPPTLTPAQSELYWSSLSERLPAGAGAAGGAAGWRAWRSRALAAQLPKQDLALAHCSHVDDAHKKQFEDFVAARNEIALDIGVASQHHGPSVECMSCTKPIRNGSIMVQAPRIGDEACFHPACFTCSECDELLVELAYCALDGRLYCVRHYGERLKPRCHACDELFISRPGVTPLPSPSTPCRRMGILLSVFVSYVGLKEAAECMRHILSGVVPASDANFDELVEYYTRLQRQTANPPALPDWTADSGLGYVAWTEDADGRLRAGAIKFHGTPSNSTALLFSTKISSFGQYSVDDAPHENGDYGSNRYPLNRTKTIISDTAESFSVGSKNKSRSATPTRSVERDRGESPARMTWQYTPKSGTPASSIERDYRESPNRTTYRYTPESPTMTLPEIQFQSYDEDKRENVTYSEEFLRSLDGIKFRPLQRSDPSGRRRSFRKRRSSSTSSRESREEELKMFTSLEEAELGPQPASGSTPDLSRRSYSRSRSREKSKDRDDAREDDDRVGDREPPKLPSFEESVENNEQSEVNEDEDDVDFWANIGD